MKPQKTICMMTVIQKSCWSNQARVLPNEPRKNAGVHGMEACLIDAFIPYSSSIRDLICFQILQWKNEGEKNYENERKRWKCMKCFWRLVLILSYLLKSPNTYLTYQSWTMILEVMFTITDNGVKFYCQ